MLVLICDKDKWTELHVLIILGIRHHTIQHAQYNYFPVAQQPKSRLGRLVLEISRSHTIRHTHTHPVEVLRTNGKHVAETSTRTTNTRDEHPYPQWVLKPRCHQSRALRPMPLAERLPGSAHKGRFTHSMPCPCR